MVQVRSGVTKPVAVSPVSQCVQIYVTLVVLLRSWLEYGLLEIERETYRLGFRQPDVEVYSVSAYIRTSGNGNRTDNTVPIESETS